MLELGVGVKVTAQTIWEKQCPSATHEPCEKGRERLGPERERLRGDVFPSWCGASLPQH